LQAQIVPRKPVLEYCTGTWCQWCPCGENIIEQIILPNIPNAIVIGYHGPAGNQPYYPDPYSTFSGNSIISGLGFYSYPSGLVDRISSSPIDRDQWYSYLNTRLNISATVSISMLSKTYDQSSQTLRGTVSVTPLTQMTGMYKLNMILLEDSLVYAQEGNDECPGSSQWVHNNVVQAMVNGYLGEDLNTSSSWAAEQAISKTLNYVVPSNFLAQHCRLVAFVYKVSSPLSKGEIQQAEQWDLIDKIVSVERIVGVDLPDRFMLEQNYPNPFNPITTIQFSLPKQSTVVLSIFNSLGMEIEVLVKQQLPPGHYRTQWTPRDMPSGVYFYQLRSDQFNETKKLLLLR